MLVKLGATVWTPKAGHECNDLLLDRRTDSADWRFCRKKIIDL